MLRRLLIPLELLGSVFGAIVPQVGSLLVIAKACDDGVTARICYDEVTTAICAGKILARLRTTPHFTSRCACRALHAAPADCSRTLLTTRQALVLSFHSNLLLTKVTGRSSTSNWDKDGVTVGTFTYRQLLFLGVGIRHEGWQGCDERLALCGV